MVYEWVDAATWQGAGQVKARLPYENPYRSEQSLEGIIGGILGVPVGAAIGGVGAVIYALVANPDGRETILALIIGPVAGAVILGLLGLVAFPI